MASALLCVSAAAALPPLFAGVMVGVVGREEAGPPVLLRVARRFCSHAARRAPVEAGPWRKGVGGGRVRRGRPSSREACSCRGAAPARHLAAAATWHLAPAPAGSPSQSSFLRPAPPPNLRPIRIELPPRPASPPTHPPSHPPAQIAWIQQTAAWPPPPRSSRPPRWLASAPRQPWSRHPGCE